MKGDVYSNKIVILLKMEKIFQLNDYIIKAAISNFNDTSISTVCPQQYIYHCLVSVQHTSVFKVIVKCDIMSSYLVVNLSKLFVKKISKPC